MARDWASTPTDKHLIPLKEISDRHDITIGAGLPTAEKGGTSISMVIFGPEEEVSCYSKPTLHSDELPFFISGSRQILVPIHHDHIAPAICYESLQPEHCQSAIKLGATICLTSVAKSQDGILKGYSDGLIIFDKDNEEVQLDNFYVSQVIGWQPPLPCYLRRTLSRFNQSLNFPLH